LVKESTGSEYLNEDYFKTNLYLEAELTESIKLAFTIPTSTEKDNYKLVFEINNYEITYFLYGMPDELRIDRKISYFINEQLIKTDTVKDNRRLSSLFVYESRDNLLYCNTWYTDKEMKYKFNATTAITSDINLYGYPVSIFKWSTTPSDKYTFLNGVNHVPSNGILIIPETNQGKELCIGLYAIKGLSVTAIYIPKTVHTIYGGNFTECSFYIECSKFDTSESAGDSVTDILAPTKILNSYIYLKDIYITSIRTNSGNFISNIDNSTIYIENLNFYAAYGPYSNNTLYLLNNCTGVICLIELFYRSNVDFEKFSFNATSSALCVTFLNGSATRSVVYTNNGSFYATKDQMKDRQFLLDNGFI
jgi:hypothetical protein